MALNRPPPCTTRRCPQPAAPSWSKGFFDLGVFPHGRIPPRPGGRRGVSPRGLTLYGGFEECEDDDCKGRYPRDVEAPPSRTVEANSTFNLRGSYELRTAFGRLGGDPRRQQPVRSAACGNLQRAPGHLRGKHLRLHGPAPVRAPDPVPVDAPAGEAHAAPPRLPTR